MNLDNLGPIVIFIIYMAISAWSKQNKARQKAKSNEKPIPKPANSQSKPAQQVGGILDQLKKELFEIDEDPIVVNQAIPEYKEEIEIPVETSQIETPPEFLEGSVRDQPITPLAKVIKLIDNEPSGQSLEELLEPYSTLEQGIILHEILGKPRARQRNDEWFHRS